MNSSPAAFVKLECLAAATKQIVKIGMQIPYRFLSEAPRPTDCETIAASPP